MTYHWLRVHTGERDWAGAYDRFAEEPLPAGVELWGAFSGLFGIGSGELVLMLHGEGAGATEAVKRAGLRIVEQHALKPTARPTAFAPLERPGLYVFRFFDVKNADVEEIVALSTQAWVTFEAADAYRSEPQGLFCQADRSAAAGVMLLLTWYDGLESWQTSRNPAPEARANFVRRHQLTTGTIAYATTLVRQ